MHICLSTCAYAFIHLYIHTTRAFVHVSMPMFYRRRRTNPMRRPKTADLATRVVEPRLHAVDENHRELGNRPEDARLDGPHAEPRLAPMSASAWCCCSRCATLGRPNLPAEILKNLSGRTHCAPVGRLQPVRGRFRPEFAHIRYFSGEPDFARVWQIAFEDTFWPHRQTRPAPDQTCPNSHPLCPESVRLWLANMCEDRRLQPLRIRRNTKLA